MLQTWSQDPFGHGYFVVPAAAYLALTRRAWVESHSPSPAYAALPLIGGLSFLWLLGNLTNTATVQQLSLVTMSIAVTWAVMGTAATRALMFPLGILFFGLPGDRLAPPLQEFTAWSAVQMLTLSGVPAVLDGQVISIAGTRWWVSEACGGINYCVASVAVGYVYAGVVYRQWRHRVALMVASALVAVAGNTLRVFTTTWLDYNGATRVAAGMLHELYGLFVFAIIMSVLFITCGRWREERPTASVVSLPQRKAVAALGSTRRIVLCATVGMLLVASGPVFAKVFSSPHRVEGSVRPKPPAVSMPWRPVDGRHMAWSPRFVTPRSEFLQTYKSGNQVVKLYVASYGANRSGVTATSSVNVLYRGTLAAGGRPESCDRF